MGANTANRRRCFTALLATLLCGCVVQSDIVPAGEGLYTVSAASETRANDVPAKVRLKAAEYCAKQGKDFRIENSETHQWLLAGTRETLTFRCVDRTAP
jgi:hypothetical protein